MSTWNIIKSPPRSQFEREHSGIQRERWQTELRKPKYTMYPMMCQKLKPIGSVAVDEGGMSCLPKMSKLRPRGIELDETEWVLDVFLWNKVDKIQGGHALDVVAKGGVHMEYSSGTGWWDIPRKVKNFVPCQRILAKWSEFWLHFCEVIWMKFMGNMQLML